MSIYRVTFTTDLLVECENENEAEMIGFKNLHDEVKNCLSSVFSIVKLESSEQLHEGEHYSLPWRSVDRKSEAEADVNDILDRVIVMRKDDL